MYVALDKQNTVNSFNFVGTNFRGLGKKGISWDS